MLKNKPKCLAPINEKPFIDILLDNCINQGLGRFILCVGHLKEQVIRYLRTRDDCEIIFSEEDQPLGTGGALKNAESFIKSNSFLVLNGDSYVKFDLKTFLNKHIETDSNITILLKMVSDQRRYGSVILDNNGKIMQFNEKNNTNYDPGLINTGVYLFNRLIFNKISEKSSFSLEKDFFPRMISQGVSGFMTKGEFIDIGTPESLNNAKHFIV